MINFSHKRTYLYKQIVETKRLIDTSYADKITVDSIAERGCFSKFHFIRLFKKTYKMTPWQYLICTRLNNAKALLVKSDESVTSICQQVGFESISSFCILFKKSTGETPIEYRERILAQEVAQNTAPLKYIPGCYTIAHKVG